MPPEEGRKKNGERRQKEEKDRAIYGDPERLHQIETDFAKHTSYIGIYNNAMNDIKRDDKSFWKSFKYRDSRLRGC